ncbi:MAG: nucleoside-diphosphate sugar epimerase [Neptuniibacter caesariensis]|uniref:Nucleoside-diphosphate sugar epimerase n=1 Tax=Neptuniibacter caesariensis TaxID=207954 RepID=A0A2G6JN62_NEPCE|nr:MAG: nucleoside-diphosphate sugar epimerase [Neptuniibacter caesariensis]
MLRQIIEAKRSTKRAISICYDVVAICLSLYLALTLRLGSFVHDTPPTLLYALAITVVITIISFIKLGLYRAILRFATADAVISVFIGAAISAITLTSCSFFLETGIPRSTPIIFFLTNLFLTGTPRLLFRSLLRLIDNGISKKQTREPVIIYGAGNTGYQLTVALEADNKKYRVVAFLDDNKKLKGSKIRGITTHHSKQLEELKNQYDVSTVLLALGNTPKSQKLDVINRIEAAKLRPLTIPPMDHIISGKARISDIKPVAIEDLLGRDPVPPNPELMHACITGKNVMVTGAGGSIGSELCRQIMTQQPNSLILFELNEFALYQIDQELQGLSETQVKVIPIIGNIQDQTTLERVITEYSIHTVYHAAAYKHVPLVEGNINTGIKNNIIGTWRCAEAAINCKVESFVLISTDKAVRPTNVMGATKRMAELVLQALAQRQNVTRFTMVRFGNVLGSSGSVIPKFKEQIANDGPITLTHKEITRYFMTIPEAAELVIQAGSMGKGGDVFVLDMGEPIKIIDLAKRMISLSGKTQKNKQNPAGDIAIEITGLRPGEKLYEELLIGGDVSGTEHPRIMSAQEISIPWAETEAYLKVFTESSDPSELKNKLIEAPLGYQSDCNSNIT